MRKHRHGVRYDSSELFYLSRLVELGFVTDHCVKAWDFEASLASSKRLTERQRCARLNAEAT